MNYLLRACGLLAAATAAAPVMAATYLISNTFDLATASIVNNSSGFGVTDSANLAPSLTVAANDTVDYKINFLPGQSITLTDIDSLIAYLKGTAGTAPHVTQSGTLKLLGTGVSLNSGTVTTGNNNTLGIAFSYDNGTLIDTAGDDISSGTYTINGLEWVGTFDTAGTYTLSGFTVTSESGSAVTAAAVPEPAGWAMMVGGFGLLGGALRRKRVAVAFA